MKLRKKELVAVASCLVIGTGAAIAVQRAAGGAHPITPDVAVSLPAAANVSLFTRAATPTDAAAEASIAQVGRRLSGARAAVPDQWKPGDAMAGTTRTALTAGGLRVWAYLTSNNKVCEGLDSGDIPWGASCTDGWSNSLPVDVNVGDLSTGAGVAWGLAPNNVLSISVVVDGIAEAAIMGENSYLYESPSSSMNFDAIVVTRTDGTVLRYQLGHAPNPIKG